MVSAQNFSRHALALTADDVNPPLLDQLKKLLSADLAAGKENSITAP